MTASRDIRAMTPDTPASIAPAAVGDVFMYKFHVRVSCDLIGHLHVKLPIIIRQMS